MDNAGETSLPVVWCRGLDETPDASSMCVVVEEREDTAQLYLRRICDGVEFWTDTVCAIIEPVVELERNDLSELDEVSNVIGAVERALQSDAVKQIYIGGECLLTLDIPQPSKTRRRASLHASLLPEIIAKALAFRGDDEVVIGITGPTARQTFFNTASAIDSSSQAIAIADTLTRRSGINVKQFSVSLGMTYEVDENGLVLASRLETVSLDDSVQVVPRDLDIFSSMLHGLSNDIQMELGLKESWIISRFSEKSNNTSLVNELASASSKSGVSVAVIYRTLASMLHLWSVEFETSMPGKVTIMKDSSKAVTTTAKLVGLEKKRLENLLVQHASKVDEAIGNRERLICLIFRGVLSWITKILPKKKAPDAGMVKSRYLRLWAKMSITSPDEMLIQSRTASLVQDGVDELEAAQLLGNAVASRISGTFASVTEQDDIWESHAVSLVSVMSPDSPLKSSIESLLEQPQSRKLFASYIRRTRFWIRSLEVRETAQDLQRSNILADLQSSGALFALKAERSLPMHEVLQSELITLARSMRAQDEFDGKESCQRVLKCFGARKVTFGRAKVFFEGASALHHLMWCRRLGKADETIAKSLQDEAYTCLATLKNEYGKAIFSTPTKRPASVRLSTPLAKPSPPPPRAILPAEITTDGSASDFTSKSAPRTSRRIPGDAFGSSAVGSIQVSVEGFDAPHVSESLMSPSMTNATSVKSTPIIPTKPKTLAGAPPIPVRSVPGVKRNANEPESVPSSTAPSVKAIASKLMGAQSPPHSLKSPSTAMASLALSFPQSSPRTPSQESPTRNSKALQSPPRPPARRDQQQVRKLPKRSFRLIALVVVTLLRSLKRSSRTRSTLFMEGYVRIAKVAVPVAERYCVLQRQSDSHPVELFCFTSEVDAHKYFFSLEFEHKKWEADVEDSWCIATCFQGESDTSIRLGLEKSSDELILRAMSREDRQRWERALCRAVKERRRSSIGDTASSVAAPALPVGPPLLESQHSGSLINSAEKQQKTVAFKQNDIAIEPNDAGEVSVRSSLKRGGSGPLGSSGVSASTVPVRPPPRTVLNPAATSVLKELIDTERQYVEDLHHLILHYRRPLELELAQHNEHKAMVSHADLGAIFGNVAQVLKAHQELVNSLDEKQALESFAQAFGEMMPFLRGIYSVYVQNYPLALSTLAKCTKQKIKFANFLQNVSSTRSCPDLESYLIKPIQRLCKYPLFMKQLEDMIGKEAGQDTLKQIIRDASVAVNRVAAEVNTQQRDATRSLRGNHLAGGAFEGLPRNLCEPGRSYLDEFMCEVTRTSNEVSSQSGAKTKFWYAFLFSDALIFAKKSTTGEKYRFRAWLDLEHVDVTASIKNPSRAIDVVYCPHHPGQPNPLDQPMAPEPTDSPSKRSMRRPSVFLKAVSMVARPPPGGSAAINPLTGNGHETIEKFYLEFDRDDDRQKAWQALTEAIGSFKETRKDLAMRIQSVRMKSHVPFIISNEESILEFAEPPGVDKRRSISTRTKGDSAFTAQGSDELMRRDFAQRALATFDA